MNLAFLRSPAGQTILTTVLAAVLLLPALALHQFNLAVAAILVFSFAFLLFSHPLYALLAYVMLIPFEELAVFEALGTPTRLAGILFFATYMFHRRFQVNLRAMPVAAWLWLLWITASLMWSPILKWDFYFQVIQLFIATLLIADYVSRFPERIGAILNGYTISAAVIACFGIYNFFSLAGASGRFTFESRVSGIEGQGVETFAFSLIPAFLTSFHRVVKPKHRKWLWLNIGLTLLFGIGMVLSGTRGSWVATLGAILILYIPKLKLRQYLLIAITLVLGITISLRVPLIAEFFNFRAGDAISSGGTGRLEIWKVSWQKYLHNPILGIGWRMAEFDLSIQDIENSRSSITWNFDEGRFTPKTTHNIYLQTLLELGIVGFVLLMLWLVYLITTPLQQDASYRDDWLVVLAIFVAMLIGGFTNPEFHKKYYWLALALPQGLRYYWLLKQKNLQAESSVINPTPHTLVMNHNLAKD
jgi:O-antigen ligase